MSSKIDINPILVELGGNVRHFSNLYRKYDIPYQLPPSESWSRHQKEQPKRFVDAAELYFMTNLLRERYEVSPQRRDTITRRVMDNLINAAKLELSSVSK